MNQQLVILNSIAMQRLHLTFNIAQSLLLVKVKCFYLLDLIIFWHFKCVYNNYGCCKMTIMRISEKLFFCSVSSYVFYKSIANFRLEKLELIRYFVADDLAMVLPTLNHLKMLFIWPEISEKEAKVGYLSVKIKSQIPSKATGS